MPPSSEVPDSWKDHTAFIFRVKKFKADPLAQCNIPEGFSNTAVRTSNLTQTPFFLMIKANKMHYFSNLF